MHTSGIVVDLRGTRFQTATRTPGTVLPSSKFLYIPNHLEASVSANRPHRS